jgi:hypothetical protein
VVLVAGSLAAAASAARPTDASVLAKSLKTSLQTSYRKTVPGLVFTKVTCSLARGAAAGRCSAAFALSARGLKGVYTIKATVNRKTGGVRWRATSVACTDGRTGKRISC